MYDEMRAAVAPAPRWASPATSRRTPPATGFVLIDGEEGGDGSVAPTLGVGLTDADGVGLTDEVGVGLAAGGSAIVVQPVHARAIARATTVRRLRVDST